MLEDIRKVKSPKIRWEDCVKQKIKMYAIKKWSTALNREELLKKAGPTGGFEPLMMMISKTSPVVHGYK
ncbi:hypothetical protein L9F63_014723, partial [Diploptera punctata]